MSLYLGIDAGSARAAAVIIDVSGKTRRVVFSESAPFAPDLLSALHLLFARLAMAADIDVDDVQAIATSAPDRAASLNLLSLLVEPRSRAAAEPPFVGRLASAWEDRYALARSRVVDAAIEADARAIGLGVIGPRAAGVLLGTSDVVVTAASSATFTNGALTRDWIRRQHALDWNAVAEVFDDPPARRLMLPWLEPEVTPAVRHTGVRRFGFDAHDARANIRAVIEGQLMSIANHASALAAEPIERVLVAGGEAQLRWLVQVMAHVFGVDVFRIDVAEPAALGAAIRAYHAERFAANEPITWQRAVSGFTEPKAGHRVSPNLRLAAAYAQLRQDYALVEVLHKDRPPIC